MDIFRLFHVFCSTYPFVSFPQIKWLVHSKFKLCHH